MAKENKKKPVPKQIGESQEDFKMETSERGKGIKELEDRHGEICEKIEQLNEEAFNIENELNYRESELKKLKEGSKK